MEFLLKMLLKKFKGKLCYSIWTLLNNSTALYIKSIPSFKLLSNIRIDRYVFPGTLHTLVFHRIFFLKNQQNHVN